MSQPRRPRRHRGWNLLALPVLLGTLAACSGGPVSGASGGGPATTAKGGSSAAASPTPTGPPGTLFDSFHYTGPTDPTLTARGWEVRTGEGGPGVKDTWSDAGASFPADTTAQGGRILQLRATTDGTAKGTKQVEVQTTTAKLFNGTFAARIHLSDKPATGKNGDHVVQSYFSISPADDSPKYSELDFEYMPNGGWGIPGPQLDTTSWFKADPVDRVTKPHKQRLEGWHVMMVTAVDGKATYSMDGKELFTSTGNYVPREKMNVHFSNWFVDLLPSLGGQRAWDVKVNWFYYKDAAAVSYADVQKTVDGFYAAGTDFVDTLPKS